MAVGREPFTKNLGIENLGVKIEKDGRIKVDKNLMTDEHGVFAIGDVI